MRQLWKCVCRCARVCACNNRRVLCQHAAPPAIHVIQLQLLLHSLGPVFPTQKPTTHFSLLPASTPSPPLLFSALDDVNPSSIYFFSLHSPSYFWLLSIPYYPTRYPTQPCNLGLHHMYASNYRVGVLYWCQTVSPLSCLFHPPLSGPSRLGYALITLSILPSCQLPCSRVVTAQGHHGSTVELWVS